jgi:hypothetical protein
LRYLIRRVFPALVLVLICALSLHSQQATSNAGPGTRSVMDAHNCYPYSEWWHDRIDRALAAGFPVAIEQDLGWYTDPKSGKSWSVVTHGDPVTGHEPTMEHYFFDRVRPIVEQAIREGNHGDWPIITLNLDFKDNNPDHLAAVRLLLLKYRSWITEAPKGNDPNTAEPLVVRPILVLTGESDAQQTVFYDQLNSNDPVLAFGAVHTAEKDYHAAPEVIDSEKATNYRRWWNNAWRVVEPAGQRHAGEWTPEKTHRLRALVERAHANGLWIRFYTLDGATEDELSCRGWFHTYNFGTITAARKRWQAAIAAGVDFIASDQYELLADEIRQSVRAHSAPSQ